MFLAAILAAATAFARATDQQTAPQHAGSSAGWRTFTNRAGWSVKYPRTWRVQSCHQCEDPTEPGAFLALSDPSSDDVVMIERLADNPEGKSVEAWLHEVAKDTVLHLSGAHNG